MFIFWEELSVQLPFLADFIQFLSGDHVLMAELSLRSRVEQENYHILLCIMGTFLPKFEGKIRMSITHG